MLLVSLLYSALRLQAYEGSLEHIDSLHAITLTAAEEQQIEPRTLAENRAKARPRQLRHGADRPSEDS